MLVKPRTPTPFREFKTGVKLSANHERAKQVSAPRIISMSSVGNERYSRKRDT